MALHPLNRKLVKVPLRYGILGGGVVMFLFLMFYFLDLDPLVNIKVIDMLILAIFIFFALKEFRDRYNNRALHFWQGMTAGVVTYLTLALVSAIFIYIMTVIIDPELTTKYIEGRTELLKQNRQNLVDTMDEATYLEAVAGVKETTPLDLALDDFLKKSIIGLFLTIIIAVILRK
ncbi:MAG: DUF4199 domain-containing protein [Cytophagales bacterium]|nr:DUF4199 domain-containing protein [Cytophagales bacterium]